MMTKSPRAQHGPIGAEEGGDGLVTATMTWIQQALCGLHGHDSLLQHQRNRIFLRCASCGYETRGWDLSRERATTVSVRADAHVTPSAADLAVARKIA